MPELPEVEVMARSVAAWTRTRSILRVDVLDAKLAERAPSAQGSSGAIVSVYRRAKYLVIETPTAALIVHFRMTGKIVRAWGDRSPRLVVNLDDGSALAFVDPRRLGEIFVVSIGEVESFFLSRRLGPEPFPDHRNGAWWRERLGSARAPIKAALMDQARVAGIGNIIASEALFRAQIHPATRPSALSDYAWDRLAGGVRAIIDASIEAELGEEITYVNERGQRTPEHFLVYGREHEACPRCGAGLARMRQSGRSTYLCPTCQPA